MVGAPALKLVMTCPPSSGVGKTKVLGPLKNPVSRDADGNWTSETLNALGFVTGITDGAGNTTTLTLDAAGTVLTQEDPDTNVTTYTRDVLGRVTQTEDARGHFSKQSFDDDGNVASTTDLNGITTTYDYDYQGQELSQTVDGTRTSSETFDGDGNVLTSTDANGNVTTNTYDAYDNLATQHTPASMTTYSYDDNNNLTTMVTSVGGTPYTTTFAYNSLNQQISETDPRGIVSTSLQDPNGNVVESIDGAGDATANYFNGAGELVLSIDPMGNLSQNKFDPAGNMVAQIDPVGNTTQYAYDSDNRVALTISPTGGQTAVTYDPAGNVSTTVDADGREKIDTYNADNQLTQEVWKSSVGGTAVNTLTYSYFNNGELETAGDSSGTYTFTDDAFGNVTMVTDGVSGLTLTYELDANNNVTQTADSQGGLITSSFNGVNEMTRTTLSATVSSTLTTMSAAISYDSIGRTTEIDRYATVGGVTTEVSDSTFGYDGSSNQTSEIASTTGGAITYTESYDNANRLVTDVRQDSSTLVTRTYGYNRDSQVISETINNGVITSTNSYNYSAGGTLNNLNGTAFTVATGDQITYDGTWYYTLDAEGNTTKMSLGEYSTTWKLTYNLRNQMTSATEYNADPDLTTASVEQTITYKYNVFGDLVSRTVTPAVGSPTTEQFAYDLGGTGQLYAELNSSGTIVEWYLNANGQNIARAGSNTDGTGWMVYNSQLQLSEVLTLSGAVADSLTNSPIGPVATETTPLWTGDGDIGSHKGSAFQEMMTDPATGLNFTDLGFQFGDGQLAGNVTALNVSSLLGLSSFSNPIQSNGNADDPFFNISVGGGNADDPFFNINVGGGNNTAGGPGLSVTPNPAVQGLVAGILNANLQPEPGPLPRVIVTLTVMPREVPRRPSWPDFSWGPDHYRLTVINEGKGMNFTGPHFGAEPIWTQKTPPAPPAPPGERLKVMPRILARSRLELWYDKKALEEKLKIAQANERQQLDNLSNLADGIQNAMKLGEIDQAEQDRAQRIADQISGIIDQIRAQQSQLQLQINQINQELAQMNQDNN